MSEHSWTPPKWMYRDRTPPSDDAYFENMTRVIFLAGLGWRMIDQKWPNFKRAFRDFSINEVAEFSEKQIEQLMSDTSIVRNRAKIVAAVNNARQFQNIRREHGSFRSYLGTLDKSNNYIGAVKELQKIQSTRSIFSTYFPLHCWRRHKEAARINVKNPLSIILG